MPSEPTHDQAIDDLTAQLLSSVDELQAQLRAHLPAAVVRQRVGLIRDIADHLYGAIESAPMRADLIIRQPGPSAGS